jgi:tRNA(Ile)-lysidine synthase
LILPPEVPSADRAWSRDHLRLHRHLLRQSQLLPAGSPLLVAVSGGQDSMALVGLLLGLGRLHGWRLCLWHGDHRWHGRSGEQAAALGQWALRQGLRLHIDRAEVAPVGEHEARRWRYRCLGRAALQEGCRHVVTGHTASDRAETVLLNLARGSHRRGLASLRSRRALDEESGAPGDPRPSLWLVRPLLIFSRADTARICGALGLPVWADPSNEDLTLARNRLRARVMPVLENLHPGACHRISAQAERLALELEQGGELLDLALRPLQIHREDGVPALARRLLSQVSAAGQGRLLQHWLERHWGGNLEAAHLDELLASLARKGSRGQRDLRGGWQLRWDPATLTLTRSTQIHG